MFVRFWMTSPVFTTTPETTLKSAIDFMNTHRCRRLPVLQLEKLVGIVSLSDLYRYLPPGGENRVALPENVEYTLVKTPVADVMRKTLITCTPATTLEDVGVLMCTHRIGALPVLDKEKLVGIITETNYLKAMAKLAHIGEGRRVCFRMVVANKTKTFYEVLARCQTHNLEVLSLTTQPVDKDHHLVFLRVRGEAVDRFIDALWKSHFDVLLADQPEPEKK